MSPELVKLLISAAFIGSVHTLIGPDHYVPFIMMAVSRKWSIMKTSIITFICGLGHVLSSIVLGFVGIALGLALDRLKGWEGFRGDLAGWALTAFGFTYLLWGLRRAWKNKPHTHFHHHDHGSHSHEHDHHHDHAHVHEKPHKASLTPWALFIIFVLGPCEPLIPMLMFPAAKGSIYGVIAVALVFGVATIATMLTVVIASTYGLNFLPLGKMERYSHALAGGAIFLCGIAIKLGL